ncbi:DUF4369 domain-containing protein [Lacinutrix sp. Bg11-31]|uniref:DUF4369 domain-containing protein n=1 Tax=Lacinutrix sp. Bg11-31 TaxID=2057808 RepID=UPI000C30E190|nr:DUF4369 domain-containing protein [Lacinutrix sp. Bg11-31]AUC80843.1 hypothetical protein CW733_01320 [Lacinutrix sp. Bg11-31]
MQKLFILLSLCFLFSCGNNSDTLIVKGNIKGLKKGTVYLKKANSTTLITVDSMVVNGNSNFLLQTEIDSPEIFYLYLDKNDTEENRITFFADKGITEINTSRKRFSYDAKINGSKQQKVFETYLSMASKFNDRNLELIKENFDAIKEKDTALISETEKNYKNLEKRKYLYTANFSITNRDSEVAPYLALTELYNANIKLLDMVNDTLTSNVKASNYGKELQSFIDKIKEKK